MSLKMISYRRPEFSLYFQKTRPEIYYFHYITFLHVYYSTTFLCVQTLLHIFNTIFWTEYLVSKFRHSDFRSVHWAIWTLERFSIAIFYKKAFTLHNLLKNFWTPPSSFKLYYHLHIYIARCGSKDSKSPVRTQICYVCIFL